MAKRRPFDRRETKQNIEKAVVSLRNLREKEGKWKDETTEEWSEEDWKKGSVVIGEGLLCFLYPTVKLKTYDANFKLPEKIMVEDIRFLMDFASSEILHNLPYNDVETSFTETAALLLRAFSFVLHENSGIPESIRQENTDKIIEICQELIKFLKDSAYKPSKGTYSWSFTEVSEWRGRIEKARPMLLDSTYNTGIVLVALCDAHNFLNLRPTDREEIFKLIQGGSEGVIECYDANISYFAKNKSSTEKNIIHSVFALESLLYCYENLERLSPSDQQKESIGSAVEKLISTIGYNLSNLAAYDQDLTWNFAYKAGEELRSGMVEDRSTLGSISNALCFSLKYISPLAVDDVYKTIDSLIQRYYRRRDSKTNIWIRNKTRIYYTLRMIEALTNCILYRTEEEFTLSKRELSEMLSKTLSSDEVVWYITEKLAKQIPSLISESDIGGK
ncbi:MAG: hypothetical protein AYK18_04445 [Theionarchaea archaeon DG-70]|nr:MAG: hypothetical protein AYK18_04445 [Theionarchaea archaeon DG-70]